MVENALILLGGLLLMGGIALWLTRRKIHQHTSP